MGIFGKMRQLGGGVSPELMQHGILARGDVVGIQLTGMSVSRGGDQVAAQKQVCVITVDVTMDNVPPYRASVRQGIPVLLLQQLQGATVAVRVNPANQSEIAIDLDTPPPVVTMASGGPNTSSAAQLLATGTPARAVIIQTQPMGMRNPAGLDMHAFLLTILCDGHAPYQVKVGNPVPANAVPLLYPGANLPAKVIPGQEGQAIVDWEAALQEFSHAKP